MNTSPLPLRLRSGPDEAVFSELEQVFPIISYISPRLPPFSRNLSTRKPQTVLVPSLGSLDNHSSLFTTGA